MISAFLGDYQIHANTANPNGIYLHTPVPGLDFPQLRYSGQDRAGASGHIAINQLYGGRLLAWEGYIANENAALYYQRRRELIAAVAILDDLHAANPQTTTLTFTMLDGAAYEMDVLLNGQPSLPLENPLANSFLLPLFAPEPQILSTDVVTSSAITPPQSGAVAVPVVVPVVMAGGGGGSLALANDGTMFTWPTITLTGPLTNPAMLNTTTGASFALNTTLGANDTVVIDMRAGTAILNQRSDVTSTQADGSDPFYLVAGPNALSFASGDPTDTGTMQVRFQPAFVGV